MDKTYDPKDIEKTCYENWEKNNYFAPSGKGQPFCLMLPPPNVTGDLHMGHGFGATIMDILVRYHRMCGDNTLWQPGLDHASISTQMVVEKRLSQTGLTRQDLGRDAFLDKVWEWKEQSGDTIMRQLRRLGTSPDWSRECFTMDEKYSQAVYEEFLQLYHEGLIYRGPRLVNWDPSLLTAVSDLEVVSTEEESKLWHIRYPLSDGSGAVIVATTRPETMLGDMAVAVHPSDKRYQHLIGMLLQLPLTQRQIPIIADDYVEKDFGSGCVKITPAHDFNDYVIGQRHNLKLLNILTPDAKINENAPERYQGLNRFVARKQILKDLEELNLIEKIEKHSNKIPRGVSSGEIIEPYLTQQWFMKMQPLVEPAVRAVEQGQIKFIPENWTKTYFLWLANIQDWCISRQLWWGHRIPAWYDSAGKIYVARNEEDARKRYKLKPNEVLTQETDVFDTWFSAALWPFATLGWPDNTSELKTFYPTNVLVTGFDIIFFWVARMIILGLKFTKQIPFKEVYITGLICDADGKKMSKSKGNGLDPLDLIDGVNLDTLISKRTYGMMQPTLAKKIENATRKQFPDGIAAHGTDALRFTFCSIATFNREIRFDLDRLESNRNFCNKLWNAARYVLMNTESFAPIGKGQNSLPDQWILSKLQRTIADTLQHIKNYRFDLLAQTLYDFTWNEFCDWYVELSKPILTSSTSDRLALAGTRHTLIFVLETLLRLLHPIIPFITEAIWQRVAPLTDIHAATIMLQPYPNASAALINESAEGEIEWIKKIVVAIRTIRSEMNIPPGKMLPILLNKGDQRDRELISKHISFIQSLARVESITWVNPKETIPESATQLVGGLDILIAMAGLINKNEELARLTREMNKLNQEKIRLEIKLKNPNFIDKAPKEVVKKEQQKILEIEIDAKKLSEQFEKISLMP